MTAHHIEISRDGRVQVLRINRPDKKNALTSPMYGALTAALQAGDADPGVGVHLFAGLPGIFSAGNDIAEFRAFAEGGGLGGEVIAFLRQLALSEKPMVAVVDGLAVGVGTTMLFHCDLVYATPQATFRTPFLDLGLVPEAGSSLLAPGLMGHQRAFELLCLGGAFSAEDARMAGLVNRLVEDGNGEPEAFAAAHALAAKPPKALKLARDLLRGPREVVLERIDAEVALFAERLRSPEALEAFMAFMEKRPPDFSKIAE